MATTPKKNAAGAAGAAAKKKRSTLTLLAGMLLVAAVCGAVMAGLVFSGGSPSDSTVAAVASGVNTPVRAAGAPAANEESAVLEASCEQKCKAGGSEVCGTDGKTYLNECFFKNAQCKNAALQKVADWKGYNCPNSCKKKIACKEIGKFLCASDGNVYFGYCNLYVAQCLDPTIQEIECDPRIFEGVFHP